MADGSTPLTPAVRKPNADGKPLLQGEFVALVAGISRFVFGLARLPAFRDHGLGLAHWAALSLLASEKKIYDGQLSRMLGATPQRIHEIKASLQEANFISLVAAPDSPDGSTVIITKRGLIHLQDVNSALMPLVEQALQSAPSAPVLFAKSVKTLDHLLSALSKAAIENGGNARFGRRRQRGRRSAAGAASTSQT